MQIKMRQAQFCNLKLLLMFLVIYGHFIEPRIGEATILMTQYKIIYMIHMPLFVFLSGLFLKTESACFRQGIWALKTYFICQGIMIVIEWILGKQKNVWTPYWHLWYLLSLVYWSWIAYGWHWIVKHFPKINHMLIKGILIALSIVVACLVGKNSEINRFLSASRTIVFLPYLLMGIFCPMNINWKKYRFVGILFGTISVVLIIFWKNKIPYTFLYQASSYGKIAFETGVKRRLVCYGIAVGLGVFLLTFFPSQRNGWSKAGVDTKWIYLFHAPIVAVLREWDIPLEVFIKIAPFVAGYILWILYKVFQWKMPICGIVSCDFRKGMMERKNIRHGERHNNKIKRVCKN